MQGAHINEQDASTARSVLKAAVKTLSEGMRLQIDASRKDGVAALVHPYYAVEFIVKAQGLEGFAGANKLAHALSDEGSVQLPAGVANTNDEIDSTTTKLVIGFGFDGGRYLLVVGAWACAINELRSHGCLLSGCDAAMLLGAAKYLHKATGLGVAASDLI